MSDEAIYLAVKTKVKGATKSVLREPDWAANMEVIDMLNSKPHLATHIARVLQKRIRHWDPVVGYLSLALSESLVKNCPSFHPYAADPMFIDSMLKELYRTKPKKTLLQMVKVQTPHVSEMSKLQRRDKILLLIESWGKAFKDSTKYPIFWATYEDLLRQNFRFPHPLKDEVSPVFTPQAKPRVLRDTDTSGPIKDYGLQNTLANVELFMDTLNESGKDLRHNDVVQTLLTTLKTSQADILDRISSDPSEELLSELLACNDEICQACDFYDRILNGTVERRKQASEVVNSFSESNSPATITPSNKHGGPAIADLLGLEFDEHAPAATSENQSYDTESGTESESESESEADSESDDESSLDDLVKDSNLMALAPPPSSGKGKSRRIGNNKALVPQSSGKQALVPHSSGQKAMVPLNTGNKALVPESSGQKAMTDPWTTSYDDDPFASFPAAPKQIEAAPEDDFMAIALRNPATDVVPSSNQRSPFDPL